MRMTYNMYIFLLACQIYVSYHITMNNTENKNFALWVQSVGGVNQAAQLIGCTPDAVRKWIKRHRIPRAITAKRIQLLSNNAVNAAMFYVEHA